MDVRAQKEEVYQAISDFSKELNGSRMRLDIDAYSLDELDAILHQIFMDLEANRKDADLAAALEASYCEPLPQATLMEVAHG